MIRQTRYTDLSKIEEIERDSFIDPWNFKMLSDAFLSNGFLGLTFIEDGEVLGYVFGKKILNEAEIELIAVKKSHRRKGVAKALLGEFLAVIKTMGVSDVFLEVRRSNVIAQSLYEKTGFNYVAVRANYYAGIEDALIMKKRIN